MVTEWFPLRGGYVSFGPHEDALYVAVLRYLVENTEGNPEVETLGDLADHVEAFFHKE